MSMTPSDFSAARRAVAETMREHWMLFLAEGIVLVVLGVLAIIIPQLASLAVTILIGWLFLISGVVGLITTFWAKGAPGFWWSLVSAVIAIGAGVVLLGWPISGTLSLTLVLIVFFVVEGVASIMYAIEHRREAVETVGLDDCERGHRPDPGRHHLLRASGHRILGPRAPGRDQHGVRRNLADRDGAGSARPARRVARDTRPRRVISPSRATSILGGGFRGACHPASARHVEAARLTVLSGG